MYVLIKDPVYMSLYAMQFNTAVTKEHGDRHCYPLQDIGMCVWQEFDYRIDICHVTNGRHIKYL
jgi:hypothetical protein